MVKIVAKENILVIIIYTYSLKPTCVKQLTLYLYTIFIHPATILTAFSTYASQRLCQTSFSKLDFLANL